MEALPDAVFAVLRNWAGIRGAELLGNIHGVNLVQILWITSLCIIFLRMKGGERSWTSNANRESDFWFDSQFFRCSFWGSWTMPCWGQMQPGGILVSKKLSCLCGVWRGVCWTEALFSAVGLGCFKFLDQLLQFAAIETSQALHWRYYTTEFETCFHSWHFLAFLGSSAAGVGLLYTAIVLMAPSIPELPTKSADPVEPRWEFFAVLALP